MLDQVVPPWSGLPPLTAARVLTDWTFDPVILVVLVTMGGLYAVGVRRLAARGDRWPWGRSVCWGMGLLLIAVATMSGLGTYDTTLFSVHMVQHMLLSMVVPLPLALGAPVTLGLRALPVGGRRALTAGLHSRVVRVVTFPLVAYVLFTGSTFGLYYSSVYGASLRSETVHAAVHLHFMAVGCLFYWPLVGIDPIPGRLTYPGRILLLVAALPFHAFLGISIMSSSSVLGGGFYEALGRPWGASLLSDQHTGGAILWSTGELVGLLVILVVAGQWMRSEERASRRLDRQADRDGDAALVAYNANLAALDQRGR